MQPSDKKVSTNEVVEVKMVRNIDRTTELWLSLTTSLVMISNCTVLILSAHHGTTRLAVSCWVRSPGRRVRISFFSAWINLRFRKLR